MKNLKLHVASIIWLAGLHTFAGGSSGFDTPRFDATVTCSGDNGEVTFNVMKKDYDGRGLSMRDGNASVFKVMDSDLLETLKEKKLITAVAWDQRAFLENLGVNINAFRENVSFLIEGRLWDPSEFQGANLSGGTLDVYYRSSLPFHKFSSEVDDVDSRLPRSQHLEVLIKELSKTQYRVVFNKLTSGHKKCTKTKMIPHPWAGAGGSIPPGAMMEVCETYQKLDRQTREHLADSLVTIDQCRLNVFKK